MTDLDGVWDVERVSGLLPPLVAVRKMIRGNRGETRIGPLAGAGFTVEGSRLRYDPPFSFCVDVVEGDGETREGRATAFGREFARFRLRRVTVADELKAQLIKHIDEAHAMEQNVLRMLNGMIQSTDDPEILDQLEHHRSETQRHSDLMETRLAAHDAAPSTVRQATGMLQALAKVPLDLVRNEKAGRNARDGYATEHLEIASYELLKRVARKAGDEETAAVCDEIIREERAMAERISANWDRFAELSLQEQGIATTAP